MAADEGPLGPNLTYAAPSPSLRQSASPGPIDPPDAQMPSEPRSPDRTSPALLVAMSELPDEPHNRAVRHSTAW